MADQPSPSVSLQGHDEQGFRFETGREAYEDDVRRDPLFFDKTPRPSWEGLCDVARYSWNRNPTRRATYTERLGKRA